MRCFAPPPRRRIGRERAPPPTPRFFITQDGEDREGQARVAEEHPARRGGLRGQEARGREDRRRGRRAPGRRALLRGQRRRHRGGRRHRHRRRSSRARPRRATKTLRVDSHPDQGQDGVPVPGPGAQGRVKGPPTKASRATKGAELATTAEAELARRAASSCAKRTVAQGGRQVGAARRSTGAALFKPERGASPSTTSSPTTPDAPEEALSDVRPVGRRPREWTRSAGRRTREKRQCADQAGGARTPTPRAYSKHRLGDAPGSSCCEGEQEEGLTPYRPATEARRGRRWTPSGAQLQSRRRTRGRTSSRTRWGTRRFDRKEAQGAARPGRARPCRNNEAAIPEARGGAVSRRRTSLYDDAISTTKPAAATAAAARRKIQIAATSPGTAR